ncbi:hypothetical protein H2204_003785 [Knufia peltigerae]|uniref:Uncharacterized protein n=1 Tax=Knufia peltigerae TaxID=1002370 RepID=A0AA38Y8S3_9EURO|nr:hypothetical protein H2204_003785 [Knufia peltigerae]
MQARQVALTGKAFNADESDETDENSRHSSIYHALLEYRTGRKPLIPNPIHTERVKADLLSQSLSQSALPTHAFSGGVVPNVMQTQATSTSIMPHVLPDSGICYDVEATDEQVSSGMRIPRFSPDQIANAFSRSAAYALNSKEVEYLIHFLKKPCVKDQGPSRQLIRAKIDAFHEDEIAMSGGSRERLAYPSGSEDAEFGVILHCQSTKGHVGEFWDPENRTIQLLIEKGLSPEFIYGFDWHWRAEESMRRADQSSCPTRRWPKGLRSLHDRFSSGLLELLPLPWVVIGGGCAKDSYRRTLSGCSKQLTIQLADAVNLEIDLNFHGTSLRRIVIYVPHPSSAFFKPSSAYNVGTVLDASINFILWLHHRDGNSNNFIETLSLISPGVRSAAPLGELYGYVARELNLGRNLILDEYKPAFLSWATTYLLESPVSVLSRGDSLAQSIRRKIGNQISSTKKSNGFDAVQIGRKGPAARYGYENKLIWDGQRVSVTQKGTFKIFLSEDQESLELRGGRPLQREVSKSPNPVTIHFSDEEITLQQDGSVVFQTTCAQIKDQNLRARWVAQLRVESREKTASMEAKIPGHITAITSLI